MRLLADSEQQAQDFADRAHAYLCATDSAYASSVAAGQTLRWDVPHQDDLGQWYILIEPRCFGAFSAEELATVEPPVGEETP